MCEKVENVGMRNGVVYEAVKREREREREIPEQLCECVSLWGGGNYGWFSGGFRTSKGGVPKQNARKHT